MENVIIVGSARPDQGYNLESYVKLNLENRGYIVTLFEYADLMGKYSNQARMAITRSNIVRTIYRPIFINKINEKLFQLASELQPKFILSIKGDIILADTLKKIRNKLGIYTVLWYPDDPSHFNSFSKYVAPHYDMMFTSSKKAIQRYRDIGVDKISFLPFGCETSVFKSNGISSQKEKKILDVFFVGTYYPRRHAIIKKLMAYNIEIYGPYWKYFLKGTNLVKR